MLDITKEFELSSISWSDQKYEAATNAALERIPILKTLLAKINKDERYRYEIVKRMITVKAKKQTELATKRRAREEAGGGGVSASGRKQSSPTRNGDTQDVMSVDSESQSPQESVPLSPKSSPIPTYSYEYRPMDHAHPKPYQLGRGTFPLSPQSAQSYSTDISDIYLAQSQRNHPPPFLYRLANMIFCFFCRIYYCV